MSLAERIASTAASANRALARIPRPALVAILVAYGIGAAFVGIHSWRYETQRTMPTRAQDISGSLRTLEAGGPPLLDCSRATDEQLRTESFKDLVEQTLCVPAGVTDDQGLSLFVPWLAQLTGTDAADIALHQLFVACFFVLFALYPLLFYGILRSLPAALAAPWILRGLREAFVVPVDHYWISAWAVLVGLPLAWLLYARWDRLGRWRWALAIGTGLLASAVTAMRINAGLSIAVATVIVVLIKGARWRQKLVLALLVVVAYLAVYPYGLDGVRAYRDHTIGVALSDRYPARHPVWHNAYIGLGVIPNRYGIAWNDAISEEFVKAKAPEVAYLSPEYERILRAEYFRLLREDTGFVLRTYLVKADTLVRRGLSSFWPGLLALPFALAIGTRRHLMRRLVAVATPAPLLGAVPPMMTIADHQYQLGWLGSLGAFFMLGATWLVAEVATLAQAPVALRNPANGRALRAAARSPWLAIVVVVVAVGAGITTARAIIEPADERASYYAERDTDLLPVPIGTTAYEWSLTKGLPHGWSTDEAAPPAATASGLEVETSTGKSTYQVQGPRVRLPPGRYVVTLTGDITSGGLELGALDATANTWLATTHYWHGQRPFDSPMATPFAIAKPTEVEVILANWTPTEAVSRWRLGRIAILQQEAR